MWIKIINSSDPIEIDCIDAIEFVSTDPCWDDVVNFAFMTKEGEGLNIYNMQMPADDITSIMALPWKESLFKDADNAVDNILASLFQNHYTSLGHGTKEHKTYE